MDQTFFVTPFASLGDQTVIPIPVDSGGAVTMQQGWGPDYQADQETDPNAKPIDRSTTNWLFFVITQAIAALQKTGIPEWITPANNNGTAIAYPKYAQVRYSATSPGVTFETYVSTVDNNTSVPGADANWQPIASIVAAASDVVAGTSSRLIVTPLTLKSYAGNSAQTFNVATAAAATQAVPLLQAQGMRRQFQGAQAINASVTLGISIAGEFLQFSSSSAVIATLPAIATMPAVYLETAFVNNGTATGTVTAATGETITVGNATVSSIVLQPGDELKIVSRATASWTAIGGSALRQFNPLLVASGTAQQAAATMGASTRGISFANGTAGTYTFTVPAGVFRVKPRICGGGGGGGGASGAGAAASGGGGGAYFEGWLSVTPGQVITYTVGAAGAGGTTAPGNGGSGGTSSATNGVWTITCGGGSGGNQAVGAVQATGAAGGVVSAAGVTDGSVYATIGGSGDIGAAISSTLAVPGQGGWSFMSGRPSTAAFNTTGNGGISNGGGGNGAASTGSAFPGGAGGSGVAIFEY